jgi:hypothetical protein
MNCPHCQSSSTSEREGSWLPAFPVPGVWAAVQRANWHGAEPGPSPNRHRVSRGLLTAALQAEPAGLGDHRTSQYKNNVLEQDHRAIKGRYRPMRGFKEFDAAHRFCRAFDEVRNFLHPDSYINQKVSLARRRAIHVQRVAALRDLISVA